MEGAHHTRTKRRHGLCLVSCSCGWSEEVVSNFGAWLATRRHIDSWAGGTARQWALSGTESHRRAQPVRGAKAHFHVEG